MVPPYRVPSTTAISLVLLAGVGHAQAQVVSPGAGVSFTLPREFVSLAGRPAPIRMSWRNKAGTISIDAIVIDYPGGDAGATAAEFQDWPGVGRSMAASFGESSARTLGKQSGVRCSYEGVPLRQDLSRMVMEMRVEVTCPTPPNPLVVRSVLINVLARTQEL